jgi:hypothetical protein
MPDFEIRRYPYADRAQVVALLDASLANTPPHLEDPARRLTEGETIVLVRVNPPRSERPA